MVIKYVMHTSYTSHTNTLEWMWMRICMSLLLLLFFSLCFGFGLQMVEEKFRASQFRLTRNEINSWIEILKMKIVMKILRYAAIISSATGVQHTDWCRFVVIRSNARHAISLFISTNVISSVQYSRLQYVVSDGRLFFAFVSIGIALDILWVFIQNVFKIWTYVENAERSFFITRNFQFRHEIAVCVCAFFHFTFRMISNPFYDYYSLQMATMAMRDTENIYIATAAATTAAVTTTATTTTATTIKRRHGTAKHGNYIQKAARL